MQTPPTLPPAALVAGKVSVAASWIAGLALLAFTDPTSSWHNIGFWLTAFLVGSHAVELLIYRAFLTAAKATPADYVQVFLFGIFHSGGMKVQG